MDKISKCRYAMPDFSSMKMRCAVDGFEDDKMRIVTKEDCEYCEKYVSLYIEYPLTVTGIENCPINKYSLRPVGKLCEIKPCGKEYENKTYLGIYLGELPISINTSYNRETGVLTNSTMNNPAIFVPNIGKIIYGCESWWRIIDSVDEFKERSKEDIVDTWYVKLLKELAKEDKDNGI